MRHSCQPSTHSLSLSLSVCVCACVCVSASEREGGSTVAVATAANQKGRSKAKQSSHKKHHGSAALFSSSGGRGQQQGSRGRSGMRRQARPVSGGSHFQLWQIAGVSGATQCDSTRDATRLDSAAIITRVHFLPPSTTPPPCSPSLLKYIFLWHFIC